MQYGVVLPNIGDGGDARTVAELAREAEDTGWDGVFVWDAMYVTDSDPAKMAIYDPWIALGAIAIRTERVTIGTMITPLSRRRPWKVARETVTLDHLTNGRLVLPVGLGALDDGGFGKVGEVTDRKARAEMLDESLEILAGLWSGKPFAFHGKHYQTEEMTFLPTPVQSPRIPVWVIGAWPRAASMRRVMRWDGLLPTKIAADGSFPAVEPADIAEMKASIDTHRTATTPFDIVFEGETPGDDPEKARAIVRPYAEAGVTWWLEESVWKCLWSGSGTAGMRARIAQGPPRIEP